MYFSNLCEEDMILLFYTIKLNTTNLV
jgi:hypothetical protein